jgi:carbon-monoxide dehydrogenase large subunit
MFLEVSGGAPAEFGGIRFVDGMLELYSGGGSTGQSHETVYKHLVAERLAIDAGRVRLVQGDSDRVPRGLTSTASRTTIAVGTVMVESIAKVIEKGRQLAADRFEASPADVEYAAGTFRVAGTDRAVSLWELGSALDVATDVKVTPNYPNGCHIAEVEIDPETGVVTLCSYVAVDDCGNVVNHTLVEAQVRGGVAQGLGQALFERAVYDPDTGQLLTGSFMDYGIPRADDMPVITCAEHVVPCTTNPLGVKGVGEAGTTGSLPTVMNAILDALAPLGVEALDMPATPEKVWRAIAEARAHRPASGSVA